MKINCAVRFCIGYIIDNDKLSIYVGSVSYLYSGYTIYCTGGKWYGSQMQYKPFKTMKERLYKIGNVLEALWNGIDIDGQTVRFVRPSINEINYNGQTGSVILCVWNRWTNDTQKYECPEFVVSGFDSNTNNKITAKLNSMLQ